MKIEKRLPAIHYKSKYFPSSKQTAKCETTKLIFAFFQVSLNFVQLGSIPLRKLKKQLFFYDNAYRPH